MRLIARLSALPVTLLLVAGCSAKPATEVSEPAATPSASSPGQDAAVLAAYRGMWDAYVQAAKTSDADAPELRRYASGDALRRIVSALIVNKNEGAVTLGTLNLDPHVNAVETAPAPTTATVLDCVDTTKWLVYRASGGLWDDKPGGRHRNTAKVVYADGSWKVDTFVLEAAGTC
jgi:hypothetical protein